jgi:excisionase family DNA binding protein
MSSTLGTDCVRTADIPDVKRLLTIPEFCRRYGRSRSRAYELIRSGELPAVKEGRSTRIPVDGAEAWVQRLMLMRVINSGPPSDQQLKPRNSTGDR